MFEDLEKLLESLHVSLNGGSERPEISRTLDLACMLAYTLGVIRGQYQRGLIAGIFGHDIEWDAMFGEQAEEQG